MAKYRVCYNIYVPTYGYAIVDASSDKDAIGEVHRRWAKGQLIDWDNLTPQPEVGCERPAVLSIRDEDDKHVSWDGPIWLDGECFPAN